MEWTPTPQTLPEEQEPPRFINQCTYTKEVYLALYHVAHSSLYRGYLLLVDILLPLILLLNLFRRAYKDVFLLGALFCVSLFLEFLLPRIRANQAVNQQIAMYQTPTKVETFFFEDHIFLHNKHSDAKATQEYGQISTILRYKNLYFLHTRPQLYYILDRIRFLQGSDRDFEAFLLSKAPHVKVKGFPPSPRRPG